MAKVREKYRKRIIEVFFGDVSNRRFGKLECGHKVPVKSNQTKTAICYFCERTDAHRTAFAKAQATRSLAN